MSSTFPRSFLAAALAATFGASPARGQAPDCTYDRCALRLQPNVFSRSLVQGVPPTPVARLGLFAPRIDLLAAAGDSARSHYTAFRTHYNRRAALTLVAIATFTASIILVSASYNASDPQQYEGAAIGLRFNNWDRVRVQRLPFLLIYAAGFGAGAVLLLVIATGRLAYRGEHEAVAA